MTVVLLGPQRFDPTVAEAAAAIGVSGRIALVTCGWQEREAEDEELSEHLGGRTVNLRLHQRAEDVFECDPEMAEAYHARQLRLRRLQDFYRIRLEYLIESARVIAQRVAPAELLAEEAEWSTQGLRVLDRYHLERCRKVHQSFREQWQPHERPAVAEHRQALAGLMRDCDALAIAGGHVATIVNRLRLFGVAQLIGDRPVLAWSAGAMAITRSVVLFHDNEPHSVSAPQLLDGGLGLVDDVVALPNPNERLQLDDRERMATYAKRFAPRRCLALPRRSWVVWQDGVLSQPHGVLELKDNGAVEALQEQPEASAAETSDADASGAQESRTGEPRAEARS